MKNKFLEKYPQLDPIQIGDYVHSKISHKKVIYKVVKITINNYLLIRCVLTPYSNFGKIGNVIQGKPEHFVKCYDFDVKQSIRIIPRGTEVKVIRPITYNIRNTFSCSEKITIYPDTKGIVKNSQLFYKNRNRIGVEFYLPDKEIYTYCLRKELLII